MATKKKMLQAAAGNAGGAGLDITEVFSTYLYGGTSSTQTITNGIDLAGEGGLIWTKQRNIDPNNHMLVDTERGLNKWLESNTTDAEGTHQNITSVSSTGYVIPGNTNAINNDAYNFTSWTFRKAPKFFDVVKISITRDGSNNLTSNNSNATVTGGVVYVNHNLGSVPGLWIQKSTDYAANWYVRSTAFTGTLDLDTTDPKSGSVTHTATSTQAMLDDYGTGTFGVGTHEYIIYLFANNDGDGEFGPDADQDIIKCGVFTPNTSGEITVDLGFEPQFLIYKNTQSAEPWIMFDTMRGWGSSVQNWASLEANANYAEVGLSQLQVTSTGFTTGGTGSLTNKAYIYMAIRRGPLAQPESGTEVFGIDRGGQSDPSYVSGFPVDMGYALQTSGGTTYTTDRLRGTKLLATSNTSAEANNNSYVFDYMDGMHSYTSSSAQVAHMWKRAPNFFDVVAYTGDGVAGRTVSHNLGVAPEMMWVKKRNSATNSSWIVYHSGNIAPNTTNAASNFLVLNSNQASLASSAHFNQTMPSSTEFTLGTSTITNNSGDTFIAYLFASLPGISKVGSYTGNGSSQTIGCGFTSGARFILIKRTDSTGDWYLWDTERGIVAGNDPHLSLNTTAAEVTSDDSIDPDNSGFIVNQVGATNINVSSASYIFYAIA